MAVEGWRAFASAPYEGALSGNSAPGRRKFLGNRDKGHWSVPATEQLLVGEQVCHEGP